MEEVVDYVCASIERENEAKSVQYGTLVRIEDAYRL
jgi:hypothetical protein